MDISMAGPSLTEFEQKIVTDVMLESAWYEKPYYYVEKFQNEFAAYHNRKYGIMTPNCTTAIHLLLTAMGIGPGDEVIVPECTWIATVSPVVQLGATPVFCDIEPETWCLDASSVSRAVTSKTRAVILVDLYGNMIKSDQLLDSSVPIVEDAAEALGSWIGPKANPTRAGKLGIGSVFSFHRTKTLTTGEGGMLLLDDDALYDYCMFLRDHGRKRGGPMYYNYACAYKYMPSNLQAALGWAQFQRIDELVGKKHQIFEWYRKFLGDDTRIQLNYETSERYNGVWCTTTVIRDKSKAELINEFHKRGLPGRPFFYPLSSLPAFPGMEMKYRKKNPVAYDISSRGVNLPSALNITYEQVQTVSNALLEILE